MQGKQRSESSEDRVIRTLYGLIARGSLRPGQPIRQEFLAEAAGVSRIPVRQVLARLNVEGLVRIMPNQTACIIDMSAEELLALHAVRELLENEAARLIVPNIVSDDLELIEEHLVAVERAVAERAVEDILEQNQLFHFAIFALAGNFYLIQEIHRFWQMTMPYRATYLASVGRWGRLLS